MSLIFLATVLVPALVPAGYCQERGAANARPHFAVAAVGENGEELSPFSRKHIPFSSRAIGFRFHASPFPGGTIPHVRYRLQPIVPVWTETAQTSVWFSSLPSGKFTFEAETANSGGTEPRVVDSVDFEVLSPWWLHPALLLVLFVAALLLIREFFRIRVRNLLKRQYELEAAVQLRTKELEAEKAELLLARQELTARAMRDGLTGLWNRAAVFEILDRELERSKRGERPVSVILADLDHFKQINDTYGHSAGDIVLIESALRLTADLRAYDSTGRYGGEELLIVLSNCDGNAALARADDLRTRLRSRPIRSEDNDIWVTASFGVAISNEHSSSNDLVREADRALYQAKRMGRDRVVAAWLPISGHEFSPNRATPSETPAIHGIQ